MRLAQVVLDLASLDRMGVDVDPALPREVLEEVQVWMGRLLPSEPSERRRSVHHDAS